VADSTPEQSGWGDVWNTISQALKHAEGTVDHALQGHHVDSLFKNSDIYGPSLRAALPRHTTMGPQPSADYGPTGLPGPKPQGSIPGVAGLLGDAASVFPGGPGPEAEGWNIINHAKAVPKMIASTEDWLKHVGNLKKQLTTRELLPNTTHSMNAIESHINAFTHSPGYVNVPAHVNEFLDQTHGLLMQVQGHVMSIIQTSPENAQRLTSLLSDALSQITKTKKSLKRTTTASGAFRLLHGAGVELDSELKAKILAKNALLGSVGKDAAKQGAANLDFALDERARAKAALAKATDASELVPFIESTRRAPYPGGQENILDPELHEALLQRFDYLSDMGAHQAKRHASDLGYALLDRAMSTRALRNPTGGVNEFGPLSKGLKRLDPDTYEASQQEFRMRAALNRGPGWNLHIGAQAPPEWIEGISDPSGMYQAPGLKSSARADLMTLLRQIAAKQGLKDLPGGGL
jgi:hypothetical protein